MENRNCEMLFEYLRSILYDSTIETLDISRLDEPYRKLGRGMQFLQHAVEEMLAYSADLSRGNLSGPVPEKDNFLCVNLKNMHANLNHLTWQAEQVAAGDYSQQVSYLGEFSRAFNMMTSQLREREAELKREAEKLQKRAEVIEGYNELLMKVTRHRSEWVFVVDADNREVVYCNKEENLEGLESEFCQKCKCENYNRDKIIQWEGDSQEVWELETVNGRYLRINSYPLVWHGRSSYVHVVADITDERRREKRLSDKAYFDSGTGIRNRLFFEEQMERILKEKKPATICYLDVDGLKYVNDRYGHLEGDHYIREFVSLIQENFRSDDVFTRIGGDEFCLVLAGLHENLARRKLEEARAEFAENNRNVYPVSFSYGIYQIDGNSDDLTMEDIIRQADARMYDYKRENKEERV